MSKCKGLKKKLCLFSIMGNKILKNSEIDRNLNTGGNAKQKNVGDKKIEDPKNKDPMLLAPSMEEDSSPGPLIGGDFLPLSAEVDSETGKHLYDAYICYALEDEAWSTSFLLDTLEKKHNMRCFVFERDSIVGEAIVDNIVRAIQDSAKVLLVITPHFKESHWCQYATQVAQQLGLSNCERKVIPILKEGGEELIPQPLVTINSLNWTSDELIKKGWEKLITSIRNPGPNITSSTNVHPTQTTEGPSTLSSTEENPDIVTSTQTASETKVDEIKNKVRLGIVASTQPAGSAMLSQMKPFFNGDPRSLDSSGSCYSFGEIQRQTIALTICSEHATNGASALSGISSNFKKDFPKLDKILVIGSATSLECGKPRLGDVVVAKAGFLSLDCAGKPSNHTLDSNLNSMVSAIQNDEDRGKEVLWKDYVSKGCKQCCKYKRPDDQEPSAHYGKIAYTYKPPKNKEEEERFKADHPGVVALESTKDGISDPACISNVGCLIVRGVAGYCSQSEASEDWERYAAMVSAAYTRLVIEKYSRSIPTESK